MDVPDRRAPQDEAAEGLIIGAVAETARDDRDQFTARFEQFKRQTDKAGIEIDRFQPRRTQQGAMTRVIADLLIGWIEDGVGVARALAKADAVRRLFDEIALDQLAFDVWPMPQRGKGGTQVGQHSIVELAGCAGDPGRSLRPFDERDGKRALSGPGVKQPDGPFRWKLEQ